MSKRLFVFEMANNHQGSVEHGKRIIKEIKRVCDDYPEFDYAFKFQYRNLDTFIHPNYINREDIKNVKRFKDTRLSLSQFQELIDCTRENGFRTMCTPFDEDSVDRIVEQKFDFLKIASCSFTDWPLLEKAAASKLPVIVSGAGSSFADCKRVISFFQNRGISISLMHCVAEYPTTNENLQMNQIDFYKKQFPKIKVGFSTHEDPNNMTPITIAISKGAEIFEKHVGVETDDIKLNGYSANPDQVRNWLETAKTACAICGVENERYTSTAKEKADLEALKRGVFVKKDSLKKAHVLTEDDYYLAFPCQPGQLVASDLSKYNKITLKTDINEKDAPVMVENVQIENTSEITMGIIKDLITLLKESNVVVPIGSKCELSHHYGMERYREIGLAMIDCVNREYCKKILAVLPGQDHPAHYHVKKEETFVILHGDLKIVLDGVERCLHKGDIMTVERNVNHSFSSENGCIFEEISTTHYRDDSFYEDALKFVSPRKTIVHFTQEMLNDINE